ncbi:MAG TPA: LysR substrate-binding domain-containing protein [Gammaproteobacteria bacterium]|nr:LysR substrate-binding domain-containing protein [Gammaproteobacteria bacterium]
MAVDESQLAARVELRHLRYFVAVAEELSFTRAAARLRTAQPSLSQQIRRLESAVGVKLLDRSRRHVVLTNAGRIFLRQANDILGRVEHARRLARQAADGRAGDLSVGTFPSADVRILPALRPLLAEHLPDLRLILHSKYAVDPLAGLKSGALDVAFVRGPLEAAGLESVELLRERIVLVLPSHHPLARRKRIPVESLDDLPCITIERSLSPALHDAAAALYRDAKIRMHAVSSADHVLGHLQLVQEGLGFALLPDSVGMLLPPGVTSRPLDSDAAPTVSVLAAWKTGNDSRLLREFVDLARRASSAHKDAPRLSRRGTKS